jgi:hypothetical protein
MKMFYMTILGIIVIGLYMLCAFASVNQIKQLHAMGMYLLVVFSFIAGLIAGEE